MHSTSALVVSVIAALAIGAVVASSVNIKCWKIFNADGCVITSR